MPFSGGSSQPRNRTQVSHTAGRFFTVWATREATGVGSLSLLQGMILTKELNRGLLHCRQVLDQLSYQGSLILVRKYDWTCTTVFESLDMTFCDTVIWWPGSKLILVFHFNRCLVEKYSSQSNTGACGKAYSYTSLMLDQYISIFCNVNLFV